MREKRSNASNDIRKRVTLQKRMMGRLEVLVSASALLHHFLKSFWSVNIAMLSINVFIHANFFSQLH